jgi:hypothetical protein
MGFLLTIINLINIYMKNFVKFFATLVPIALVGVFFVTNNANASVANQTITLNPGWNIISTPKVLTSHQFSAAETSANFNIYLLDPTATSGWQTMQGVGQTEFQPLFAYFINNKTGTNQTLQLNYNFNITIPQRLFQRTLSPGWNAVGVASPSYALSQGAPSSADSNNPSNILSSVSNAVGQVIDFTNGNTNLDSPAISSTWLSKTITDVNSLNDFRELKGYGVFVTNATNNYNGSQNLQVTTGVAPVITLNGASTINLLVGNSYTDAGATASDSIDGDITSNIITINPVNTNIVGTYTITYNVSNSSGNHAQQITRTVIVEYVADIYTRVSPNSPVTGQQVVSKTQTTSNVVLGVFSLKSTNNPATLNILRVGISGSVAPSVLLSNFRLFVNGSSIANGVLSDSIITFNNMTVPLTQDVWTDVTVEADIGANADGTIQLVLTPSNVDPYNPVVSDIATIETGTKTTNVLTLTSNYLNVTNATATLGSAITQSNSTIGYNATYAFTLTNNSNNDLFVSSAANSFVTMQDASGAALPTVLTNVTTSPSTINGDVAGTDYAIPAGTSRTFTFSAALYGTSGHSVTAKAYTINYGTATDTLAHLTAYTIGQSNLSALTLTASF